MKIRDIKKMMDKNGHIRGSLDLSGTQITALPDGLTVGGSLDLSGMQWAQADLSVLRKFASPWFAETLRVDAIHIATGWCKDGIREAMGAIGLKRDDDVESYDRAEVHAALRRASAAIGDNDRTSIALAILDRVEAGK